MAQAILQYRFKGLQNLLARRQYTPGPIRNSDIEYGTVSFARETPYDHTPRIAHIERSIGQQLLLSTGISIDLTSWFNFSVYPGGIQVGWHNDANSGKFQPTDPVRVIINLDGDGVIQWLPHYEHVLNALWVPEASEMIENTPMSPGDVALMYCLPTHNAFALSDIRTIATVDLDSLGTEL